MALASGKSTVRTGALTLHTETAIDIAQKLTGVSLLLPTWCGGGVLTHHPTVLTAIQYDSQSMAVITI